ncbi:NUDIX domain-containing protein [Streptomyces sp. NPDC006365]|uniref:NUDIX domain-containing protein n=1 Tax=Streptomyces sp. NPDC006365 TaxID=3364744 RepID=UPI0036A165FE
MHGRSPPGSHQRPHQLPAEDSIRLLRWHQRHQSWLLVGGHADPGERNPLAIALREGREETGLPDLTPWPDAEVRHLVIVPVPANSREQAHEHAVFPVDGDDPGVVSPGPSESFREIVRDRGTMYGMTTNRKVHAA